MWHASSDGRYFPVLSHFFLSCVFVKGDTLRKLRMPTTTTMDGNNETNDGLGITASSPWYDASKTMNMMDDEGTKSKKKKKKVSSLMTGQLNLPNNNNDSEEARLGIGTSMRSPSNEPIATIQLWNEMESRIKSWDEMETKETMNENGLETIDFDEVSDYENYHRQTSARRNDDNDPVITRTTMNNNDNMRDIQDLATKGTNETGSSSNGISNGSDCFPTGSSSIDDPDSITTRRRRRKTLVCYLLILVLILGGTAILAVLAGKSLLNKKEEPTDANTLNNSNNNESDLEGEETNLVDEEETKLTEPPQPKPTEVSHPTDAPVTLTSNPATPSPTGKPSLAPTRPPSPPSPSPSETPTSHPSETPSSVPTNTPPTGTPTTSAPTVFHVDPNPVPLNPPPGYFNYNVNDTMYGPNAWHLVDTSQHWLIEFTRNGFGSYRGHLEDKDPLLNRCSGSAGNAQSPINLVSNLARCDATHEIRSWCGSRSLDFEEYQRLILPHKLSLVLNRRNCVGSGSGCSNGRPPIIDYPRYSAGTKQQFSDLLNLDIKIPAEHSLENVTYDAEIQMLHTHLDPDPARASSLGLPIRATADGYNSEFQELLSLFQSTYNNHAQRCRRNQRQLRHSSSLRKGDSNGVEGNEQRDLQDDVPQEIKFNPYSDAFMPGHFFYRYEGSMTEPPCMDITWFVMMEPMIISLDQLEQMKLLLFTHVDENCQKTSVHNGDLSVARPRFPVGDVAVQKCDGGTFVSDIEMGGDPANKCSP